MAGTIGYECEDWEKFDSDFNAATGGEFEVGRVPAQVYESGR